MKRKRVWKLYANGSFLFLVFGRGVDLTPNYELGRKTTRKKGVDSS